MQTETTELRTQLLDDHRPARDSECRDALPLHSRTWLRTERGTALNRCGAEQGKQSLALCERVDVQLILLPHQATSVTEKRRYEDYGVLDQDPLVGPQLGDEDSRYTGQVFSPPYLDFTNNGFTARPVIDSVQAPIEFNDVDGTFEVEVIRADVANHSIDRVVMMRPAAITHHFDNDQRYVELWNGFPLPQSVTSGGEVVETFTVTIPGADEVPPGYYMLFVIETDGTSSTELGHRVPSVGQFVQVR